MEVRCSNCETEYEFDDALVSARGTSVKCTQCGHQFRVRRAGAASPVGESWLVKTAAGKEINFKSLRELQQGIVQGTLNEDDSLTHGGQPSRPLKDIYELQTFFASARARAAHPASKRTLLGGAGDLNLPRASSLPPPRKRPDPVTPVGGVAAVSIPEPSKAPSTEFSAPAGSSLPAPSAVSRVSVPPAPRLPAEATDPGGSFAKTAAGDDSVRRSTPPRRVTERPSPSFGAGSLSSDLGGSDSLNTGSLPSDLGSSGSEPLVDGNVPKQDVPWQNMQGLHSAESEIPPLAGRPSGARSRWIAALVVFGGLGLVGGTVGKDYILKFVEPPVQVPVVDKRVPALLQAAYTALGRSDFEAARIAIAKAEVLAENDINVAAALARLEVSHAESHWLELRVLEQLAVKVAPKKRLRSAKARAAATAEAEALATAREVRRVSADKSLQSRLKKARAALAGVADAKSVASKTGRMAAKPIAPEVEPIEVVRVRVDLLRLEGKLSEARRGVQRLSAQPSNPDNAHTLGALDLAEEGAGLMAAIGRLRIAARRESALGKSRSLLVYALVRSADRAAAVLELDKLRLMAEQHPLLADLKTLVERLPEQAPVATDKQAQTSAVAAPKKSRAARTTGRRASTAARSAVAVPTDSSAVPNNNTAAVEKAERLHRAGDLAGAERLYSAVLSRSPGQVGALSGMGDVYRQRGATAKAMAYYNRVLAQQPMHLRTVMASADMNWASKRREAAVNLYRRALGQVGTSHPYGARALRRIERYETSGKVAAPKLQAPAKSSGAVPPSYAAPTPPAGAVPPVAPGASAPKTVAAPKRAPKKKAPAKPRHPFAIPSRVTPLSAPIAPSAGAGTRVAPNAPAGTP